MNNLAKPAPCSPRKAFKTELQARTVATHIARRKGLLRYAVPCAKCKMWHLQ